MDRIEIGYEYFEWMCSLIDYPSFVRNKSYQKLLHYLNEHEFTYILPMDENRADDGVDLRYRFGYVYDYPVPVISTYLDYKPCSILEMMVALANRCEEDTMRDLDIGNRTGKWFWDMIVSLGLQNMTDSAFNEDYIDEVIQTFLNRDYSYNGKGGLFTVRHPGRDFRTIEIWYQMMKYLDEILYI